MHIIRIIIVILVIILILTPGFELTKRPGIYGVLLLDGSLSMRRNKIQASLNFSSPYPLKKFIFNKDEERTGIGEAIYKAKRKFPHAAFMVLYSDGMNNYGTSPTSASKKVQIPIFVIVPEGKKTGISLIRSPHSILEGDTAEYYISSGKGKISIYINGKFLGKKVIRKKTEVKIPVFMEHPGNVKIRFVYKGDSIVDTLSVLTRVIERPSYRIYYTQPDWNYKFLKRELEKKGWKEKEHPSFYIFLSPDKGLGERIKTLMERGERIFIIGSFKKSSIIPLVGYSTKEIDFEGKIPMKIFVPKVVLPGAKPISFRGYTSGIIYKKRGIIYQSLLPEMWKFFISASGILGKDFLSSYLDTVITYLGLNIPRIEMPIKIPEENSAQISFSGGKPDFIVIDSTMFPVNDLSFTIPPLSSGWHSINFLFKMDTIKDSIYVFSPQERRGIDRELLERIAEISGGKVIKNKIPDDVKPVEYKVHIQLNHNPIVYLIIIILLLTSWIFWMRRS